MTTASKITMARVLMIPVFMITLYSDWEYGEFIALAVFIVACVTDSIDGYIARHYNQITDFGKFIDPLADKLLVFAALLIFVERGQMSSWAAMLILTREFAVTALRLVAVDGGVVIAAGTSGKIKTVTSMVGICVMLTPLRELVIFGLSVNNVSVWLMLLTTLWSGIEYFYQNRALLDVGR